MFGQQRNGRKYTTLEEKEEGDDTVEIVLTSDRGDGPSDKPSFDSARLSDDGNAACGSDFFLWRWYHTLTFGFLNPLLKKGNERPLEMDDLYPLDPADRAFAVYEKFTETWQRYAARSSTPLFRTFTEAFGRPFFMAGFLKLVHDSCLFVGPQLLKAIIQFLRQPNAPLWQGMLYVLGLFVANLTMSLCLRQYFYLCYSTGMRLRSAVVTATYHKALVLSAGAKRQRTTGEITNLMSIDSQRMQDLTPYLHAVWYSVFQIAIALTFLWVELGPACLGGIAVTILMIPITAYVAKKMSSIQSQLMRLRDERVKLNTEVLSGMKVIKLQAWEQSYQERILELREREMQLFKKYVIIGAISGTLWVSIPLLVALVTFIVYVHLGNELDVATALTSLALFDILRFPLFMLPQVVHNVVEAKVSVNRIEEFLQAPERVPVPTGPTFKKGVRFRKAYLIWEGKRVLTGDMAATYNPLQTQGEEDAANGASPAAGQLRRRRSSRRYQRVAGETSDAASEEELSEQEWEAVLLQAQLQDYGTYIDKLENEVQLLRRQQSSLSHRPSELEGSAMMEAVSGSEASDTPRSSAVGADGADSPSDIRSILTLRRVDFEANMGELIAVVGLVGTGKSSLIASMLGDLRLLSGGISVCGRVAYVGQRPFIQNATLRQNICFGLPFDRQRYIEVLEACAMIPDLKVLPAGDRTEIGEKGINLSGGQKARVALARAVYANADLYLLDDPLAAVDSHVGKHLFEQCIDKLLRARGKCVVLVTNAFHVLPHVNRIVVMHNGCVVETGSYDALMARGTHFKRLMQSFQATIQASDSESAPSLLLDEAQPANDAEATTRVRDRRPSVAEETNLDEIIGPDTEVDDDAGRLIKAEDREVGSVSMKVYGKWIASSGGMHVAVICLALYAIAQSAKVLTQWWLSYWSANRGAHTAYYFLAIYGIINVGSIVVILVRELHFGLKAWEAGRTMFRELLNTIMHAPMSFFDTTPIGRVINRFSKDIYTTDEQIPDTMSSYLGTISQVISVVLVICIVTPLFIVALLPIVAFYMYSQHYYIKTSRELKRLDSITRSPIFALFGETLEGATTIRAYGASERFFERNATLLDKNQQAYYLTFTGNCWLAVRLEMVGTLIITFAALFAVLGHEQAGVEFAGMAGLAISLALSVTQSLNWSVRMASDLEAQMVAIERISEYTQIPTERPHFIPENDPPPEWPQYGAIEMNNVSLRYRPGLPLVLKSVTLSIPARCKLGIVGRTGAGKSSMVLALLRLVELESGTIHIDGVNVANIGLHALRSKVSVIPQDPVLFSGTVRSNIDPFNRFSDAQLWDGLRRTRLDTRVQSLDETVEENGANFSVGQRQLLCIARALLSGARIIIMDEATAAVDVETDALIQRSIRVEFADCTCLTIAHRLNTIMDSTRVLVLDQGRVAEYDTPSKLLANPRSMFSELVNNWEAGNEA